MSIHHSLSADGLAVLAMTARVSGGGARSSGGDDELKPLTARQWAELAGLLQRRGEAPSTLLGRETGEIADAIAGESAVSPEMIARLAGRASTLAMEAERLQSRGIWVLSVVDEAYPSRLRECLGASAPPILYGAGSVSLLESGGIAIVGARNADAEALAFAEAAAGALARSQRQVVSGGARGIDAAAMTGAAEAGGTVVGAIADSLERQSRSTTIRSLVSEERLVLVSAYGSDVPFSVGTAMGRNRLIYCLADAALIVSASEGEGGTWAGATEALKAGWVPVHVRTGPSVPAGNAALVALGAHAFVGDPTDAAILAIEPAGYERSPTDADHEDKVAEQQTLFGGSAQPPGSRS